MNRYDQLRADYERQRRKLEGMPVPAAPDGARPPEGDEGRDSARRAGLPEKGAVPEGRVLPAVRQPAGRRLLGLNLGLALVDAIGIWLLLAK